MCAWGGVIGPLAFVAAWSISGVATAGFSAIEDAISDLAAVGADTRVTMTAGFVIFGLGLIAFGVAVRDQLAGPAWVAAVATGASTIGVAATPLDGWSGDGVHALFAGLGYVSIVALPLLAARPIAARGSRVLARASFGIALVAGACLVASTLGPAHGLWQRLGLTIADAWIMATAIGLLAAHRPGVARGPARS
jgi:hypothetical membrane protein